jgi:hypothetical protein
LRKRMAMLRQDILVIDKLLNTMNTNTLGLQPQHQ